MVAGTLGANFCGPLTVKFCYGLVVMLARWLAALLMIVLIIGGMIGRASLWGEGHATAYCCCGPHDASEECHCLDCPTAHHDDDGQVAQHKPRPPSEPTIKRCVLDADSIILHGNSLAVMRPTSFDVARLVTELEPLAPEGPRPEPARPRIEKPPRHS
ncbi:MAG: hypothetical protein R3B48_15840 [Kofleriaceae bacterium]